MTEQPKESERTGAPPITEMSDAEIRRTFDVLRLDVAVRGVPLGDNASHGSPLMYFPISAETSA
ncbi:MAG: hypothetical protein WAU42_11550 [Solirubrobacteraceae bacterium]